MSETIQQELSRRLRFELNQPHKSVHDEVVVMSKTKNFVEVGLYNITKESYRIVVSKRLPPTRGLTQVYQEGWGSGDVLMVGKKEHVLELLDLLRKRQVLDDLAAIDP